ncbi:MAG TPA: SCO family protein [Thermoanaerobaculia bacterium]|nr:SCO family protein [Thermoanaerobaculia bacterium]
MRKLLIATLLVCAPFALGDAPMRIADVPVVDQNGASKRFYSGLVKDRIVAINFIFTSCTTICPTLGATFAGVQSRLGDSAKDVSLISVTLDPITDTPARLAAWSKRMGGKEGWTLVTGEPSEIDELLKSIGAFTPDKNDHGPLLVIGDDRTGRWQRMNGFTAPAKIADALQALGKQRAEATPAAQYFGTLPLVDQNGRSVDLYRDLLHGRTVVMNAFFADCKMTCPVMASAYRAIQSRFAGRLGRDLVLISITVDPASDTPPKLKALAAQLEAKEGWYFLSGSPEQVHAALRRIGLYAENRDGHSNLFLIGNDRTGLWKKALGVAGIDAVVDVVASVVDDSVPRAAATVSP